MTRPYPSERRSLRVQRWPQRDQDLLARATATGGLLDDAGLGAHWAPKTRRGYIWIYGRWLTYLSLCLGLDLSGDPGERATREHLAAFIVTLRAQRLCALTIFTYLKGLYVMLWAMMPDRDWSWLRDEVNRLHRRIERSSSVEDLPDTLLALRIGCREMDKAERDPALNPIERAIRFRNALLIAFQATMGLRLGELTLMTATARHLMFIDGTIRVTFTRAERKNKRHLDKPVLPDLVDHIRRYLDHHRQILLQGNRHDAFWVNQYGKPLGYGGINDRLLEMSSRYLKKGTRSHKFRHGLASKLVEVAPEEAMAAAGLLGNGFPTADAYYIRGTTKIAAVVHGEIVADLRREARAAEGQKGSKAP